MGSIVSIGIITYIGTSQYCLNWHHHLPRQKSVLSQLVSSLTYAQVSIVSIGIITYLGTSQYCFNWYHHLPRHKSVLSQLVSSLTSAQVFNLGRLPFWPS